jgi:hypothetical protein
MALVTGFAWCTTFLAGRRSQTISSLDRDASRAGLKIVAKLAAHVDAARQQQYEQHDDQYPSPNRHCRLLVQVVCPKEDARDAFV